MRTEKLHKNGVKVDSGHTYPQELSASSIRNAVRICSRQCGGLNTPRTGGEFSPAAARHFADVLNREADMAERLAWEGGGK